MTLRLGPIYLVFIKRRAKSEWVVVVGGGICAYRGGVDKGHALKRAVTLIRPIDSGVGETPCSAPKRSAETLGCDNPRVAKFRTYRVILDMRTVGDLDLYSSAYVGDGAKGALGVLYTPKP